MDPQIQAAFLTTLFTIVAGILGYAFREYRNRVKPFIVVKHIEGEIVKDGSEVEVHQSVIDCLDESFCINTLESKDTLAQLRATLNDCKTVLNNGADFIGILNKIIDGCNAENPNTINNALSRLLASSVYEKLLIYAIIADKIKIPDVNTSLPKVIPVSYSGEREEGTYEIGVMKSATTFGWKLEKYILYKEKFLRFVQLIERLDTVGLKQFFTDMKSLTEAEIARAKEIQPIVDNILDENSRWEFQIYIANLGDSPFLVSRQAMLFVKSNDLGAKFEESCQLGIMRETDDGVKRELSDSPLVIGKEDGILFSYVTENIQGKMKRGKVFRDEYLTGNGQCWIEIPIEKVGLFRHSKIITPKVKFVSSKK